MFFSLPNLTSHTVTPLPDPWNLSPPPIDPARFPDKRAWSKWCMDAQTRHHFLSCFEGVSAGVRIGDQRENAPYKLHGLIADYDAPLDLEKDARAAVDQPASEHLPAYVSRTYSGNGHVVWLFEHPICLPNQPRFVKALLAMAAKRLKLHKWFRGWEEQTFYNPAKYYEIGRDWTPIFSDYRIPKSSLQAWVFEASKDLSFPTGLMREVPLSRVREEIERRWPGRWVGAFEVKSRGCRVWDPTSQDETACQVHPNGFIVWNGDPKPFMSWGDLFGPAWVEQFNSNILSTVCEDIFYERANKAYWYRTEDGRYEHRSIEELTRKLRSLGMDDRRQGRDRCSEVDRALLNVMEHNAVEEAGSFLFRPPGRFRINTDEVLNTSMVRVISPAPKGLLRTSADIARYMPFLSGFFNAFLAKDVVDGMGQTEWLFSWMKVFYVGGYNLTPIPGQAVVLGGPEGVGKSLFIEAILGALMGGCWDAKGFIVDGDRFNDKPLQMPVLKVDDSPGSTDPRKQARVSETVKMLVANSTFASEEKYRKARYTQFNGRVLIAVNLDGDSSRLIPSVEFSSRTKISLLKTAGVGETGFKFPPKHEIETILPQELPYLARALINWKIPDRLLNVDDNRYTLRPFHHPDLLRISLQAAAAHELMEILYEWLKELRKQYADKTAVWEGTAGELLKAMVITPGLDLLLRRYLNSSAALGRHLQVLSRRGLPIEILPLRHGNQLYRIPIHLFATLDTRPIVGEVSKEAVDVPRLMSAMCDQASH